MPNFKYFRGFPNIFSSSWTVELNQDLSAFRNIDAELTALLSEQLSQEIDREIMRRLHLPIYNDTLESFKYFK